MISLVAGFTENLPTTFVQAEIDKAEINRTKLSLMQNKCNFRQIVQL